MTPGDVIWDVPTKIGIEGQTPYIPRNYDGVFHGPMIMRYALANSYNIPAVQTLRRYGVAYLLGLMKRSIAIGRPNLEKGSRLKYRSEMGLLAQ